MIDLMTSFDPMMFGPIWTFLTLFGGGLLGLVAGLIRKRRLVDTIIYIVVAEVFGVGLHILLVHPISSLVDYLHPVKLSSLYDNAFNNAISATVLSIVVSSPTLFGGLLGVFCVGTARRLILGVQSHELNAARNHSIKLRYALLSLAVLSSLSLVNATLTSGKEWWSDIGLSLGFVVSFIALPILTGYAVAVIGVRSP